MTKIVFNFPNRKTSSLSCFWIETGNPAQPLARRWIDRQGSGADLEVVGANGLGICRLSA
jgi:hypothetical protein